MNGAEAARLRGEILSDAGRLLRDELVAEAWGRVLIEVVRTPGGEPLVAGIDVDEIVGNEAHVEAAFSGGAARSALPILAKATEALCALEGVELDDVRGGTFVHAGEGFAWLPGLVRAPSLKFDRERDILVGRMQGKNAVLHERFEADRVELDLDGPILRWLARDRSVGAARATLVGTFARAPRTWAWAWSNQSAAEAVRKASAALTDMLVERDLWEINTPVFPTDESTAWALAALVCDRTNADGVQRIARDDGLLFVLLRDVRDE